MRPTMAGQGTSGMSEPLVWLSGLLWPGDAGLTDPIGAGGPAAVTRSWLVLPSGESPTILIPERGAAASMALRQFNDSMTQAARVKKVIAGALVRARLGRLVTRDRVTRVAEDGREGADDFLGHHLPSLLGVSRVEVAISIGRRLRPNLKPVLQVMSPDGRVLAYAKIGWNELTTRLVVNEAQTLRSWEASRPDGFDVPRLLHHGRWNGLTLTLTSPLSHHVVRRGRRNLLPHPAITLEVAARGGIDQAPLQETALWTGLPHRLPASQDASSRGIIQAAARMAERCGDERFILGSWHGDWAPWNLAHSRGGLDIWDWERSEDRTPLGFDVVHFLFELALRDGDPPDQAAGVALRRSEQHFRSLGIQAHQDRLIRDLYLIERMVRVEEGRAAGVPVQERLTSSLLDVLGREGES